MLNKVIEIVRAAGEIMKNSAVSVEQKGNASNYVTNVDKAVEDFLEEKLLALHPDSHVVGEEGDGKVYDQGDIWIIDPIDGTSNFIRGLGLNVISVALYNGKTPKIGVVYDIYRDEMFYAETGKGAYLNGERIHVSDRDYKHSHLCSAMSTYRKDLAKPCFNIIERIYMESDDLRRLGSAAIELAYLAAGRVELYFEMRIFCWDVAAAIVLIKEAGGYVGMYEGDEICLDRPFLIYAANSKESLDKLGTIIHEEIPTLPY